MDGRYKLSVNLLDTDELYDLEKDPFEMNNLIDSEENAGIRNRLHDSMLTQMERMQDPFRSIQWANRPWRPNYVTPYHYVNHRKERAYFIYDHG